MFSTCFSTARDFQSGWYLDWKKRLDFSDRIYRKFWEQAFVCETLRSHWLLGNETNGIGFGVGSEVLPSWFAEEGSRIVATDSLSPEWHETHGKFSGMNTHDRIETMVMDMNSINQFLANRFDFSWSVCAMDHCGSTWLSKRFLLNQMNLLQVNGIAVHTAEYTVTTGMPREGGTVYFTAGDILDIANLMQSLGHELAPVNWFIGDSVEDHIIDTPPYEGHVHLKAEMCQGRWGTCVGFAARRLSSKVLWLPENESIARQIIAQLSHSHT